MADELLTAKEAAKELQVHINTLWKYLLSGKLKGFKRGGNGKSKHHWFIRWEDLETFRTGLTLPRLKAEDSQV